ncbi:acyltransferase domain-containing protein [Streptomyces sp. NPDC059690]|uniref:acyltransferase domain-containing protein n=1 Tax=Streptomyces sp. NPDC059690 TaxID=3346907 RepID=UPI0036AE51F6
MDLVTTGGFSSRAPTPSPRCPLYGTQLALAELWRFYGVEPAAVVGYSMGEVAAAVVAGALDPAEGTRVIAVRSQPLATLRGDGGGGPHRRGTRRHRTAVSGSPPRRAHLGQKTVTGEAPAVARLVEHLTAQGRTARTMPVEGAGHSPQVEPLIPELVARLGDVRGRSGTAVRVYPTVHDDPIRSCDFDAAYWVANLRSPVRPAGALAAAAADGHTAFVEISPHPLLPRALAENLSDALHLPTLRRDDDPALEPV